jgi:CheY-like chemotaxis protein
MPKILIVDDNPSILKMLRQLFAVAGYAVSVAGDAEDALAACRSEVFDAVLSDVRMRGMNGHDLARRLAAEQLTAHVVLMSADDVDCDECPYSPRCQVVRKPFSIPDLVSLVDSALRSGRP